VPGIVNGFAFHSVGCSYTRVALSDPKGLAGLLPPPQTTRLHAKVPIDLENVGWLDLVTAYGPTEPNMSVSLEEREAQPCSSPKLGCRRVVSELALGVPSASSASKVLRIRVIPTFRWALNACDGAHSVAFSNTTHHDLGA
jgi:hypothetical protein